MSNTVEEATFDIEPYKLHLLEEGPPQVKREKLNILQLDRFLKLSKYMHGLNQGIH